MSIVWEGWQVFRKTIPERWDIGTELKDLNKRVHCVDRRRGLWAFISLCWLFLFLTTVLSDKGAILIELAIHPLAIVNQAVITIFFFHSPVWRCSTSFFQRLVIFCITFKRPRNPLKGGRGKEWEQPKKKSTVLTLRGHTIIIVFSWRIFGQWVKIY